MKRQIKILLIFALLASANIAFGQSSFQTRSILGQFRGVPFQITKVTKADCESWFADPDGKPQSIFRNPWDAAITYYYQTNRERISITTDADWDRLIYTAETFPGPGIPSVTTINYFGSTGNADNQFRRPMGIDVTCEPVGGQGYSTGQYGASDVNDLHIFVADKGNDRILHLLYRRNMTGPIIFPSVTPIIRPQAQAGRYFPQMYAPLDVTCDPVYWDQWGQIYVLTNDCYIRSINLNNGQWGTSVQGGYGELNTMYFSPSSICARQGYLVATDFGQRKIVLYKCYQDRLEYQDVHYFDVGSHPVNVSIDQFKDVFVADEGLSVVHKLHIIDDDGGKLEYLAEYASEDISQNTLQNPRCLTVGTKELLWDRSSDMLIYENWSENSGVSAYYVGADVSSVQAAETYEEPGCATMELKIEFVVTGPVGYSLLEVRNSANQRVYPPVGQPVSGTFGESGRKSITVELNNQTDFRGEYTFRIIFDSEAEKFEDGEPVVSDIQRETQFMAGYFVNVPSAPDLSGTVGMAGRNVYLDWEDVLTADNYYLEYRDNQGAWSTPVKLSVSEYIFNQVELLHTYSFRVRASNNRGYSQYSDINSIYVTFPFEQTINLASGWNWVSSHVSPLYEIHGSAKIEDCVQDINPVNLFQVKDGAGRFYTPNPYSNNIPQWNYEEGYQIKTTAAGEHMTMRGRMIDPLTPIVFTTTGWKYIAYFPRTEIDPETAMESLIDPTIKFSILKNSAGKFYSPSTHFNNIGTMKPGQGYQINMTSTGTLIYNDGVDGIPVSSTKGSSSRLGAEPHSQDLDAEAIHYRYARTDQFFPIIVSGIEIQGYNVVTGDEIGAFLPNGTCIGGEPLTGGFPVGLAVWQDDQTTAEIDGFTSLDSVTFRIWSQELGVEADLSEGMGVFSTVQGANGEHVLDIKSFSSGTNGFIPRVYFLESPYPNPFNSVTRVSYGLPEAASVRLLVFDTNGREVLSLVNSNQSPGFYRASWDGTNTEGTQVSSGMYFIRLETPKYSKIQKLMLLR